MRVTARRDCSASQAITAPRHGATTAESSPASYATSLAILTESAARAATIARRRRGPSRHISWHGTTARAPAAQRCARSASCSRRRRRRCSWGPRGRRLPHGASGTLRWRGPLSSSRPDNRLHPTPGGPRGPPGVFYCARAQSTAGAARASPAGRWWRVWFRQSIDCDCLSAIGLRLTSCLVRPRYMASCSASIVWARPPSSRRGPRWSSPSCYEPIGGAVRTGARFGACDAQSAPFLALSRFV